MNQKLADTLAGWRQNRYEDSPSIAALDMAERLLAGLTHDPRCVYAFDNGIGVEINSLSEIDISDNGTITVVFWNESRDGVLAMIRLTTIEVPA